MWDLRGKAARYVRRWLRDWQTWRQSGFEEAALKAAALAAEAAAGPGAGKKRGGGGGGGGKKRRRGDEEEDEEEETEEGKGGGMYGVEGLEGSDSESSRGSGRRWQAREPRSTMLVTGPPGSGKTALCYAAAQRLGFEVIEINATQVCACCWVGFWFSPSPGVFSDTDARKTKYTTHLNNNFTHT